VTRFAACVGALPLVAAEGSWACGESLRGTMGRAGNALRGRVRGSAVADRRRQVFLPRPRRLSARRCAAPHALAVDATMPEHRHGMNYRPTVVARGTGIYRADGLMFHMPGRWDLLFDLVTPAGTERLTATVLLE
jgi:hypothetical protein